MKKRTKPVPAVTESRPRTEKPRAIEGDALRDVQGAGDTGWSGSGGWAGGNG